MRSLGGQTGQQCYGCEILPTEILESRNTIEPPEKRPTNKNQYKFSVRYVHNTHSFTLPSDSPF